jgi:excisionase family DNA binding protein
VPEPLGLPFFFYPNWRMALDILDCKELGFYLKVKSSTIRVWVSQGTIPFLKLQPGEKGTVRFDRKEIDRWIHSCLRRERRVEKRQNGKE